MTPFPPSEGRTGATNTPDPSPSALDGVQAARGETRDSSSWAAVEALAALMEPEAFNPDQPADEVWRERTRNVALGHAATLIMCADYRRVVEDDDTIERLAEIRALSKALEASRQHAQRARREALAEDTCRFWSGVGGFLRSRIRALEAGEEPDWPDAANSIRADLGSCVRCGVRDAADGKQLCEQCDSELEAEVAQGRAVVRALRNEDR
jgi:hypothetical protein